MVWKYWFRQKLYCTQLKIYHKVSHDIKSRNIISLYLLFFLYVCLFGFPPKVLLNEPLQAKTEYLGLTFSACLLTKSCFGFVWKLKHTSIFGRKLSWVLLCFWVLLWVFKSESILEAFSICEGKAAFYDLLFNQSVCCFILIKL